MIDFVANRAVESSSPLYKMKAGKEELYLKAGSELDTFLLRIALKDAKVETGGATPTSITGDTLAELARKHQVAENVINRLGGFMDAEALRAIAHASATRAWAK